MGDIGRERLKIAIVTSTADQIAMSNLRLGMPVQIINSKWSNQKYNLDLGAEELLSVQGKVLSSLDIESPLVFNGLMELLDNPKYDQDKDDDDDDQMKDDDDQLMQQPPPLQQEGHLVGTGPGGHSRNKCSMQGCREKHQPIETCSAPDCNRDVHKSCWEGIMARFSLSPIEGAAFCTKKHYQNYKRLISTDNYTWTNDSAQGKSKSYLCMVLCASNNLKAYVICHMQRQERSRPF